MTGAIMAAPLIYAGKVAADFEATMSKVQAITGANAEEIATLDKEARRLGASTRYTASQAGEAMTFLGMAGWNTQQILAAMPGMLSLAAAGNVDLAVTADIVSDTMTGFGIEAAKAGHVADIFAKTATSTNTTVEMLGETMKYVAPVAKMVGMSLEETSAIAGLMANAAVKSGMSGRAMRAGLLRLIDPPKDAAESLAELNVEIIDGEGNMRDIASIMADLSDKTKDLTQEQKTQHLSAIFGTQSISGWAAALDQGNDAMVGLRDALINSDGAADKMAKTMTNNAAGAMIELQSATEGVAIAFGSVFLPKAAELMKSAAQVATNIVVWTDENPKLAKTLGYTAAAVAGLTLSVGILGWTYNALKGTVGSVLIGMIKFHRWMFLVTSATTGMTKAQWLLNAAMNANPIGLVIVGVMALVAAGYLLYRNWDTVKNFFITLWDTPIVKFALMLTPVGWLIAAGLSLVTNWETVKQWFILLWDDPKAALTQFTDAILNKFKDTIKWIEDKWNSLKRFLGAPINSNVTMSTPETGIQPLPGLSTGGVFGKGAFLTTFAEQSGESAIPHERTSRNIGLWRKTGEILGVGGGSSTSINIDYKPNITVNGNTDPTVIAQKIKAVVDESLNDLERRIAEIQRNKERRSYA
ncbi:phage tail tape measure protein [Selenomonadales bacterium OttesenSCG-928-I06]|nr:phage tail tape measure protein [Selenomonadales bacterium OttesenSCG-928-I06]